MTAPRAISAELTLKKGRNTIDFINGLVVNQSVSPISVTKFDPPGSKYYMNKIRSLLVFVEADVTAEFVGASIEFDMMSFNKILRNIELETIDIIINSTFVPDAVKVIFVASDDPLFNFSTSNNRPHMFYSNSLTAVDTEWRTLFYRHTILDKLKIQLFNNITRSGNVARDLSVDIQHREMNTADAYDQWVSYDGFPKDLLAGNVLSFGDDALRDTRHHFHRVLVKTKIAAQTTLVDGTLLNI
ncbi:MAG: hypothetical protein AB1753_04150 [Thermoproteota archaeon]